MFTERNIVAFEGRCNKKSIHKTLVGSRVQTPESLKSSTKHNELDVVVESRERIYEHEQRGEICRHLHGRGSGRHHVLSCRVL